MWLPVMGFKGCLVVFVMVFLSCQSKAGDVLSGFKAKYTKNLLECSVEHPVPPEEMLKVIRDHQVPEGDNMKCMLACVFKKTGMTGDDGKISPEGIRELAKMTAGVNPEVVQKTEDFIEACSPVNDEEVIGEKEECERAVLIFRCSVKQAQAKTKAGV